MQGGDKNSYHPIVLSMYMVPYNKTMMFDINDEAAHIKYSATVKA